jgi:hypothetical protein
MVKDGGRAENERVWKLRVYEENTVAPSLGKAGQKRSLKQCGPTHSSGGAHAVCTRGLKVVVVDGGWEGWV